MIAENSNRETVVVIGHGMVGHRFCEKLVERDTEKKFKIATFCEEPRAAYDRVGLTSFFAHRDAEKLILAQIEWYREKGIELHIGERANRIDRPNQVVYSDSGVSIPYDHLVLATGSYPFVPPIHGVEKVGVFVYRTIEDLERIIEHSAKSKTAAVIGGGLLGLEAAKATHDLGLKTHVIECAPRLMPRQVDAAGSSILVDKIEALGVDVHLSKQTDEIAGPGKVEGVRFVDGELLETDMVVISAGIRARDDLARDCGLALGERGGIVVDDELRTDDPKIFAMGEVAIHRSMIYGLVAPGYEMAEIVAANLCGDERRFEGGDLSAKLKLMGVDVASFGENEASGEDVCPLTYEDPFTGIYKKLLFNREGTKLLGGVLVGDASDYGILQALSRSEEPLTIPPGDLLGGGSAALGGADALSNEAQICSCNMVSKGAICEAIGAQELRSVDEVKRCTQAGMGCGGCLPLVTDIFKQEMKNAGVTLVNHLCEHFKFSRQELFQIIQIKEYTSFEAVLENEGTGCGCEICKPTVASILASLWNEWVVDHDTIQDTNDRFLANIQRKGLYSVVPRVPGGEITPDKLMELGRIGKKYNLYTKITGGQRVDLFGARIQQLPEIWEELVDAGFESGHAYGKALRTVKSCVGTTWCRFAVQDSVGFAIRVENRYKGIRAPHKIKSAVSGCTRECAEAQSKDFGLIATENGWNLYVCGNGGTNPRHADLFATDLDEKTVIQYVDRFLMYYIHTADKLTRTSVWLGRLEGGIDYLREVIIDDKLGICAKLEEDMERLVGRYKCEWAEVVKNPEKRKKFTHFVNSEEPDHTITYTPEREQQRPEFWSETNGNHEEVALHNEELKNGNIDLNWVKLARVSDFPKDGGMAVKYGDHQIAIYNFSSRGAWYACQNMCPHKRDMVLSRGIIGDEQGRAKVACPMHKKTFCLSSGHGLNDPNYSIHTFEVKVEGEDVWVQLPPVDALDRFNLLDREKSGCSTCKVAEVARLPG